MKKIAKWAVFSMVAVAAFATLPARAELPGSGTAAVTDSSILSGLAAGDGAVAITNGQYLAVRMVGMVRMVWMV